MPGRSKDLSVVHRDSIVELVRGGHSYQVTSMLEIPKTTMHNIFKKYDSRGTTENAQKIRGEEKVWTIVMAEIFSEV
jgi:transposase